MKPYLLTLLIGAIAMLSDFTARGDRQSNPRYGFGPRVTVGPSNVVSGHSVIGRDPDPSIRNELLREYDSGRTE
jgi:hypothetical protein